MAARPLYKSPYAQVITVVDAFAKGEMLQVLLIAMLFGFAALHLVGGRGTAPWCST